MNWWTTLSSLIEPNFQIGPFQLHYYGLVIAFGFIAALWLAQRRASRYGLNKTDVENAGWWAIGWGLIGARLYHVMDYWEYYQNNLGQILAIWQGGLGIYGGLVGGIVGLWLVSRWRKMSLPSLLDLGAPSMSLAQAIGRWGNFFNQEAYGPPTNVPWKIFIDESHRLSGLETYEFFHPTFLYESVWNSLICVFLLWLERNFKLKPGQLLGGYLLLYGLGRLILEFWRLDTAVISDLKVAQILSIGAICIGLWLILRRHTTLTLIKSASDSK